MTAQVYDLSVAREDYTARLREAGWRDKERLGKCIWAHPETGCWYSEEMALEMEARRKANGEEE